MEGRRIGVLTPINSPTVFEEMITLSRRLADLARGLTQTMDEIQSLREAVLHLAHTQTNERRNLQESVNLDDTGPPSLHSSSGSSSGPQR